VYRAGSGQRSARIEKLVDAEVSNFQSSPGDWGGVKRMRVSSGKKGTEKSFI
jgi:hypothetical protein